MQCNQCKQTVALPIVYDNIAYCEFCWHHAPSMETDTTCYLCDAPGTWNGEDAYYCAEHDVPTCPECGWYPCACRPQAPRERINEINRTGY